MSHKKKMHKILKHARQIMGEEEESDLSPTSLPSPALFSTFEKRLFKSLKTYFKLKEKESKLSDKKSNTLKKTAKKIRNLQKEIESLELAS